MVWTCHVDRRLCRKEVRLRWCGHVMRTGDYVGRRLG